MANKSIDIAPNPRNRPSSLDAFVSGEPTATEKPQMKRLTFDIPADLHKRIKRACLERDEDMAAEIRRLLDEHFPPEI